MGNSINLEVFLQYLSKVIPLVIIPTTKQCGNVFLHDSIFSMSQFSLCMCIYIYIYDTKGKKV